jgi:hypothetical protein
MLNHHELELAWALSESVGPRVSETDQHQIYIALGLGEPLAAIRIMLQLAVSHRIALSVDLVAAARLWSRAYWGSPDEDPLRDLLELVEVEPA